MSKLCNLKSNGYSFIIYYEVKGILRKGRLNLSLEGSPRKCYDRKE